MKQGLKTVTCKRLAHAIENDVRAKIAMTTASTAFID
jgi:hypothetical protein